MRGRKNKPTAKKKLEGNPGKRRLNKNEPKPPSGIPSMPKWLKEFPEAVKEWRRESKILKRMGLITEAETSVLANRSYIGAQLITLAKEIKDEGYTIETDRGISANPKVLRLEKLLSEHRQYGTLLGMDPSSRARLKVETEPEDPLEQFMRKKETSNGLSVVGGTKA